MAHEILSVKLCQLDERMGRLHSRIHLSETASCDQLQREIDALTQECQESEIGLRDILRRSKSPMVSVLAQSYGQMEQIIQKAKKEMEAVARDSTGEETITEEKILLAEYALDFAHQAADRALLLSMKAIEAQKVQSTKEREAK